jgi:conflict system STAND superfamily ATPase
MSGLNPFFHRGPVRDPAYFFGRARETAYIADLLRAGQSVALTGQRRFGKTSLLFHLAHEKISTAYGLEPDTTRWVYLDGGMFDGLDEEWLYGAIDRMLGGDADAVPYPRFVESLRAWQTQGLRLMLALDEFELIAANARLGPALFNHLRALAAQFPLQFITASRDPLLQLTFAHRETMSSPFFNIFAPVHLGLLDEDEASDLLITLSTQRGRPFTPELAKALIQFVGSHPLFVQVAGYRTFAAEADKQTALSSILGLVRSQIAADLEQHLQYYWNNLPASAQYTLAALPLLELKHDAPQLHPLTRAGLLQVQTGASGDRQTSYLGQVVEEFVRRQSVDGLLQREPFLLDLRRNLATVHGQSVRLTPTELAALKLLMEHSGETLTAEAIESALWPDEISPDPERARGVIKKLRAALGRAGEAIVNRRGQGWALENRS